MNSVHVPKGHVPHAKTAPPHVPKWHFGWCQNGTLVILIIILNNNTNNKTYIHTKNKFLRDRNGA